VLITGAQWRVGELARIAGVTVRALHHYDDLGLLVPSERTQAGHRLYSAADVERLYRLLALREVGLPLDEIAPLLDRHDGIADTVRRHLGRVEQQLGALERLRVRLTRLLTALEGEEDSTQHLLDAMEAMTMFEKYYTPEQLQQLEQRRQDLGEDAIKAVEQEWQEIYAKLADLRERGVDPAAPEAQAVGDRAGELVQMFTGGDPGIARSRQRMYQNEDPQKLTRGMGSREDMEYLVAVRKVSS